jgi:hypothetical protein
MLTRIIFIGLLGLIAGSQGPQPWMGTWKLNPAKSTAAPDRYKRVITKIEPWQDGLKVTYEMVGTRGGVSYLEWTGKFDGKDYPVEGADYIMTNAYTLLNDHSYQIVVKVEGSPAATARVEVSGDGKTLTTVTTEKNGRGQTISTTAVYERT